MTITRILATALTTLALTAGGTTAAQAHHYDSTNPAPATTDLATFCANIHNQHPACAGQPAPAPVVDPAPVTTVTLAEFCQSPANRHPACLEVRDEVRPAKATRKGKRHHKAGTRHAVAIKA